MLNITTIASSTIINLGTKRVFTSSGNVLNTAVALLDYGGISAVADTYHRQLSIVTKREGFSSSSSSSNGSYGMIYGNNKRNHVFSLIYHQPQHQKHLSYSLSPVRCYSSTTNNNENDTNNQTKEEENIKLREVIERGAASLESSNEQIGYSRDTQKTLFGKRAAEVSQEPSIEQRIEAERVYQELMDILENTIMTKQQWAPMFCCDGGRDPIQIVKVTVNKNLRLARVYWSLPLSVSFNKTKKDKKKWIAVMQQRLETGGGRNSGKPGRAGKLVQKLLHTRLRSYYPPKLRFIHVPLHLTDQGMI